LNLSPADIALGYLVKQSFGLTQTDILTQLHDLTAYRGLLLNYQKD